MIIGRIIETWKNFLHPINKCLRCQNCEIFSSTFFVDYLVLGASIKSECVQLLEVSNCETFITSISYIVQKRTWHLVNHSQ